MTKDDFVELCERLLALGATEVSGGIFKASFRPPQAPPQRRGEERASNGPPKPQSPDDARHGYYRRVMGGGED